MPPTLPPSNASVAEAQGKLRAALAPHRWRFGLGELSRRALDGVTIGLATGAVLWLLARLTNPTLQPWALSLPLVLGLALGLSTGAPSRRVSTYLSIWLDRHLVGRGLITSALFPSEASGFQPEVLAQATRLLASTPARTPNPLRSRHLTLPAVGLSLVLLRFLVPAATSAPELAATSSATTSPLNQSPALQSLRREIRTLRKPLNDPGATQLNRSLARQLERVLDSENSTELTRGLHALATRVQQEQLKAASARTQKARQAAAAMLRQNPNTANAADALAEGDDERFRKQLSSIVKDGDDDARAEARASVSAAQRAIRSLGAPSVIELLEQQKLELSPGSPAPARRGPSAEVGSGSDESQKAARKGDAVLPRAQRDPSAPSAFESDHDQAEAHTKDQGLMAGETMSPAGTTPQPNAFTPEQSGSLSTGKQLQPLSPGAPATEPEQRLDAFAKALERALSELQQPVNQASEAAGLNQPNQSAERRAGSAPGAGQRGASGHHLGDSETARTPEELARVSPRFQAAESMGNLETGRTSARPGERASVPESTGVGEAPPGELQGVERTRVPREYREQVSRYFSAQ